MSYRPSVPSVCGSPVPGRTRAPVRRPGPWWRWGESNPRPVRFQRRRLRAQPTASFRVVNRCRHVYPRPYPEVISTVGLRRPHGCLLHCVARSGEAGTHRANRLLLRQPVPDCRRHVCVSRRFNEDSGVPRLASGASTLTVETVSPPCGANIRRHVPMLAGWVNRGGSRLLPGCGDVSADGPCPSPAAAPAPLSGAVCQRCAAPWPAQARPWHSRWTGTRTAGSG